MVYNCKVKVSNSRETLNKMSQSPGVIVFGTGNFGIIVLNALKKANIKVIYLSDNNETRWGKIWNGYKVVSPQELKSTNNQIPILIASLNFPYMRKQLQELKITNFMTVIFYFQN